MVVQQAVDPLQLNQWVAAAVKAQLQLPRQRQLPHSLRRRRQRIRQQQRRRQLTRRQQLPLQQPLLLRLRPQSRGLRLRPDRVPRQPHAHKLQHLVG